MPPIPVTNTFPSLSPESFNSVFSVNFIMTLYTREAPEPLLDFGIFSFPEYSFVIPGVMDYLCLLGFLSTSHRFILDSPSSAQITTYLIQ